MRNTLIETGLKNDDHKIIKDATESTVARKLREMKFALSLEQKYSKQQILEGYLNIAAFSPLRPSGVGGLLAALPSIKHAKGI